MAKKRLGGLSKIHVAKLNSDGTTYVAPVAISGAKSIEAELSYENVTFYSDNAADYTDYIFSGGEGTLTVSGLTVSEYNTLFGSTVANGGVLVKTTDAAPEVAILFERKKLGTNFKMLYVVYAARFTPPTLSAQTLEGGIEEETVELQFTIRELTDASVFYMVDTETANATVVSNWYTSVQKPA